MGFSPSKRRGAEARLADLASYLSALLDGIRDEVLPHIPVQKYQPVSGGSLLRPPVPAWPR